MFTRAISKKPCRALIDGITTAQFVEPGEKPDYDLAVKQHDKYVEVLESLGLEVLDLDAYTGGFNLQIAWSTGWLAGRSAAEK